jgi:hypothetical protein
VFAAGSAVEKSATALAGDEVRIEAAMIAKGKSRRVIFKPDNCRFLAEFYKNYKNRAFWRGGYFFLFAFPSIR